MKQKLLDILKESVNQGGVKKNLYRNLKLSKRNEFYEQDENFRVKKSAYDVMIERLRAYFKYLQTLDNVSEMKTNMENGGLYYTNNTYRDIFLGLKLSGLNLDNVGRQTSFEKLYALLVNYEHNGGKNRDFNSGNIEIIPVTIWDTDVRYKQNTIDYGDSYGTVFTTNKDKAVELAVNDPFKYETDREVFDHEYSGEPFDTRLTKIVPRVIKLLPTTFAITPNR